MFQHTTLDHQKIDFPLGKVVCVGRNYAEHAKELGNDVPDAPILFIKPATAVVPLEPGFSIPQDQGSVHHELEIALLIEKPASHIKAADAWQYISHIGLALDLTLRDVQSKLKEKSHPWEISKAFDGACPLSKWLPVANISNCDDIQITFHRNGQLQQSGSSTQMITNIPDLLAYMSQFFTLQPGDVILTGTPAGVGPLHLGDKIDMVLDNQVRFTSKVRV